MISKIVLHYLKTPVAVLTSQEDIQAFEMLIAKEKYITTGGVLDDTQHVDEITFRQSIPITVSNRVFRVTHCELVYRLDDLKQFRRRAEHENA